MQFRDEMWQYLQDRGMTCSFYYDSGDKMWVTNVKSGSEGPIVATGSHETSVEKSKSYAIEKAYIKVISKGTFDE